MTVTPQTPENIESPSQPEFQFDWRNCWYPVTFIQDFPSERPYSFSIYGEPLVLFQDQTGKIIGLQDRCPHRAAKLSDGQVIEGKIECLYHGWQFGNQGNCVHIPQLLDTAKIPKNSCVPSFVVVEHQEMIWIWLGDSEKADPQLIPTIPDLEQPGLFRVDTVADLPFDQTYLVENFLDPAHVSISHDRTEYKIKREDAQPLEMEIISVDLLLMEHRKWLDQFGANLPHYQGYFTHQHLQNTTTANLSSRFLRHTQICSSCNRAYKTTQQVKQISLAIAIALAAVGIVSDGYLSILTVSAALLAVIIAVLAQQLKTHFEM